MEKNINKILFAISIILISITFIITLFFSPLWVSDELWNFNSVFKMYNGFTIYNDSNVIVTPLFFYIEFIIFKIFGATFFTFRISNLLIILPLLLFYYKILKQLKVTKCINLFFVSVIIYNTFLFLTSNGPNYNNLALLFFIIGLYYYISDKNSDYLQGFIAFLVFFTKQTTGLFYILAIFIYELYKLKFSKVFFKNQIKKLITFSIPLFLSLLLLYLNGNLINFINYTIGGLLDFSRNNFYFKAKIYIIFVILTSYLLSLVIFIFKEKLLNSGIKEDFFEKLIILNIFSSCASLILYPVCNVAHLLMILPLFFIILAYIFNIFFEDFFSNTFFQMVVNITSVGILLALLLSISNELIPPYTKEECTFISDINNPYFGTFIFENDMKKLNSLINYIEFRNQNGIDVIICYSDAAYIMIPLKQSHGAYDLIFYGNLGYNGIEKMKQDILSREHTEFLILNNDNIKVNQFVIEIHDFIKENLTKIGEISHYDVYTK